MRSALEDLFAGLRQPALMPVVIGALVTVCGLWIAQAWWESDSIADLEVESVLRRVDDDRGAAWWLLASVRREPADGEYVHVIGSSGLREGIRSQESLAAEFARRGRPDVRVRSFVSLAQSLATTAAVVEHLPPGRGVVVVGVNQNRFAKPPAQVVEQLDGLGLPGSAPGLLAFAPASTAWRARATGGLLPLVRFCQDYVKEHRRTLTRCELPHTSLEMHRYDEEPDLGLDGQRALVQAWLDLDAAAFEENFEFNLGLLRHIVDDVVERGYVPLLLEMPRNMVAEDGRLDAVHARCADVCRQLAAETEAVYVDFIPEMSLPADAFYDLTHLRPHARVLFEQRLAAELSELL